MARISTLLVLLALSLSSFAQLSVTLEDSTMCPGDTLWFKASGMTLYAWSDTVNLDTALLVDSVNFSTTTPGMYTITVLGYNVFPVDTDTVSFSITVFDNPSVSITSSAGNSFCVGSSTELVATAGLSSYMWMPTANLSDSTNDTVIATPAGATTYFVYVTDSNGCMGMDSIDLDVTAGPSVAISSTTDATNGYLCLGSTATLTANAAGIASYEWSPVGSLNDSTGMSVQATPTTTTTYTVVVTDTNGCTGSESILVQVNATATSLTVNVEDDTICLGASTRITLQTNAQTFVWTPGATLNNPNNKDVTATPTTTTTYTVTATRNGCSTVGSATIHVLPAPSMSVSQSSGGQNICLDETDVITVDCPTCVSYKWVFPNSTLTTSNTTQTVSPNIAGAINIGITGYDDNACSTNESVTVNVDSCFVGTPFSVGELNKTDIQLFTREGQIEFMAEGQITNLRLFNLLGEEVANLQNRDNSVVVSSSNLASGVYVARLVVEGQEVVKKVYLK